MKNTSLIVLVFLFIYSSSILAQNRTIPIDTTVVTNHTVNINGSEVAYTATTGTQPVWDDGGKAVATLYYTYYKSKNSTNMAERPLIMSFNGGPGSASVWMHMA
jgi:carboxypeptidase C (cathepsin A)